MAVSSQQQSRFCEDFLNRIEPTEYYPQVRQLLADWELKRKSSVGAIEAFVGITNLLRGREQLVLELNKCLDREASIPLKSSRSEIIDAARSHQNYHRVLDCVQNFIKNDVSVVQAVPQPKVQELNDRELLQRIEAHPLCGLIIKSLHLYLKCIATLKELRSLLLPVLNTDKQLFQHISQLAEEIQTKRRKVTVFAPLNQLVDKKYPVDQIGCSYIIIPDGYANYGKNWSANAHQRALNRKCVSVPLGQESSFIIARKNQFQQQLFDNESQKYQIDNAIQTLKVLVSQLDKNKRVESSLLEKVLARLYPGQNIYKIICRKPQSLKQVILPRIQQKLTELLKCREKFQKHCHEIAIKNFEKSLDYRCFYFRKNDKKFNSQPRYDKQIIMRHDQLLEKPEVKEGIEDRQSFQRPRHFLVNTFDHITKEKFIEDKAIDLDFDRKLDSEYPAFPGNQILFILNFSNRDVLNDALEIILFHCTKKSLLELLVFKLMGITIQRRLLKDPGILRNIDLKANSNDRNGEKGNGGENVQNSNLNMGCQLLNERKERKGIKESNIDQEFFELIEEEIEPTHLQEMESPFEGPDGHTFVATRPIYFFVRFLLTFYQRLLKAKQISCEKCPNSEEDVDISPYSLLLASLAFKLKDAKLNDYLRNILRKEAFIFLTLDKLINSLIKILNNFSTDSLTYQLIKEGTKDYEMEIKKWQDFRFPSTFQQLVRIAHQKEMLFRFSFVATEGNIYVSAWNNESVEQADSRRNHLSLSLPDKKTRAKKNTVRCKEPAFFENGLSEYFSGANTHKIDMKGEELIIRTGKNSSRKVEISQLEKFERELSKLKRVKLN